MLQPFMHQLSQMRVVLASGSPRRKTILQNIGLDFEVIPSTFEENLDKSLFVHAHEYVLQTARVKALEVATKLQAQQVKPDIVIGCDTVVTMDDKIFEKPRDKDHAYQMLSSYSGGSHTVITGVVIVTGDDLRHETSVREEGFNVTSFHEMTDVQFTTFTPDVINAYIATGEPLDKAGGFGIQAAGGTLVEGIRGDYFNVMGFPLHRFSKLLYQMLSDKFPPDTSSRTVNSDGKS